MLIYEVVEKFSNVELGSLPARISAFFLAATLLSAHLLGPISLRKSLTVSSMQSRSFRHCPSLPEQLESPPGEKGLWEDGIAECHTLTVNTSSCRSWNAWCCELREHCRSQIYILKKMEPIPNEIKHLGSPHSVVSTTAHLLLQYVGSNIYLCLNLVRLVEWADSYRG